MTVEPDPTPDPIPHVDDVDPVPHPSGVDYESAPLDRSTYITAIIHLYRGEMNRANAWRQRLDQTTNWAIFTTATALGFAFNDPAHSHFSLQFANLLLIILLFLEARRFRFFDVWRARLRMIETNFFGPILRRDLESRQVDWGAYVAQDLVTPRFHISQLQAVRLRLLKNYVPILGVVLLAWLIKLFTHPTTTLETGELLERLRISFVPGQWMIVVIGSVYGALLGIAVFARVDPRHRDDWGIGEPIRDVEAQ